MPLKAWLGSGGPGEPMGTVVLSRPGKEPGKCPRGCLGWGRPGDILGVGVGETEASQAIRQQPLPLLPLPGFALGSDAGGMSG